MFDSVWRREPTAPAAPAVPETPSRAAVLLASGHLLKVRGVTLYPFESLAEVARLRELAGSKLGGVSTGIGFLGSPGWAIGGGIALGLLEKAMSSSSRKEGLNLLREAEQKSLELLQRGMSFSINQIANRDEPTPRLWLAQRHVPRTVNYAALSRADKSQFLLTYRKDKGDVVDGVMNVEDTRQYAHDGGEFVTVDTSAGLMKIRWQHVASYSIAPDMQPSDAEVGP